MAKTYTLTSTVMKGGQRNSWGNAGYPSYFLVGGTGESRFVGKFNSSTERYFATYIMFDATTLASLRTKTITSVSLKVTVKSGTIFGSSSTSHLIGYKYTNGQGSSSASDAWQRGNVDSTATTSSATSDVAGYLRSSSSQSQTASNTVLNISLATTLPKYGYVIGCSNDGLTSYITLDSTAVLTVTTNETDYTLKLSYSANGGSGAPSAQTATVTTTGTPSYTFTVPSTVPTRTGYTFLGWATSSSATSATVQPSQTYTITANTTLYAVWQINTYTVTYNKGSHGTGTNTTDTKTYGVDLTLKGAIFTRTGYKQSGWSTTDGGSLAYGLSSTYSANAAITLYPFWEVTSSTISADNGTIGTAIPITITRASSEYTHTVSYAFGTASGTIGTNIGTSVNWTPPMSLCSEIPAAGSGQCVLTCMTYQGATLIGSSSITITLSVPTSVKCTITGVTLAETVASVASQFNAYVQTKSKLSVTVATSDSGAYGASVSAYSISINGQVLTENGAITTALATEGTNNYSVTITDTRGKTDTYTGSFNVLAYVSPSVTASADRDSTTNTTINVEYGWTISPVNNLNTKRVVIRYRLSGDYWTTATTITPSTYTGTGTYAITGTDQNGYYEVQVSVTDYFTTVNTVEDVASSGDRVLYYSASDMTVAKHMENPKDGRDHQGKREVFHDGIVLGNTLLTEADLIRLLALL